MRPLFDILSRQRQPIANPARRITDPQTLTEHVEGLHADRARVLAAAYAATPERFVRRPPHPPALPTAAWINKPDNNEETRLTKKTRDDRLIQLDRLRAHEDRAPEGGYLHRQRRSSSAPFGPTWPGRGRTGTAASQPLRVSSADRPADAEAPSPRPPLSLAAAG